MYTCTHVHMYTCTHIHMYTCTHIRIYAYTLIHIYSYTHAHIYSYTHTHIHTHTNMHECPHLRANIYDIIISISHLSINTSMPFRCYSRLHIEWHRILRLFLKNFNLVPSVSGFSWWDVDDGFVGNTLQHILQHPLPHKLQHTLQHPLDTWWWQIYHEYHVITWY